MGKAVKQSDRTEKSNLDATIVYVRIRGLLSLEDSITRWSAFIGSMLAALRAGTKPASAAAAAGTITAPARGLS